MTDNAVITVNTGGLAVADLVATEVFVSNSPLAEVNLSGFVGLRGEIGSQGQQGPQGIPGPNSIGGVSIVVARLEPDDVLQYDGTCWKNLPGVTLTDGGNF